MLFKLCLEANRQKTNMAWNATNMTTGEYFTTNDVTLVVTTYDINRL